MIILSPQQIEEVLKIVDKYTLTFVAQSIGVDILSKEDKVILENAGVDISGIDLHDSEVVQAFKFGLLSDALGHAAASKLTYKQFTSSLKEGTFIPLNRHESAMLQSIQYNTYAHVSKLGGNIKNDIRTGIVEVDRQGMARAGSVVRDATKEAIEKRRSVTHIVSIIGKKTELWNKDLLRIADYNMHEAFNQGRISNIERGALAGTMVYFDVYPGACKHCIRLYLSSGFGSEPKKFKMITVKTNGTNIGRKAVEWKATVGPIHPYCRCTINEVPEGYLWDPATRSYTKPDKEGIKKVERKSKVNVTVTRDGKSKTTVI